MPSVVDNSIAVDWCIRLIARAGTPSGGIAYTCCDPHAELCLHQVDGKMGKGGLLLELRMLRLADHQAAVRAKIEKEQEEIQGMSERNYRKFARNCLRQRIEIIKQVSEGSLPPCKALLPAVSIANWLCCMRHEAACLCKTKHWPSCRMKQTMPSRHCSVDFIFRSFCS